MGDLGDYRTKNKHCCSTYTWLCFAGKQIDVYLNRACCNMITEY